MFLKKLQNAQESTYAGVPSAGSKVVSLSVLQNFYGHVFYGTAPMAATNYSGLYNFISNSNGTSLDKEN